LLPDLEPDPVGTVVKVVVKGKPEPAGSKKVLPRHGLRYPITILSVKQLLALSVVVDDNSQGRSWKKTISAVARYEMAQGDPLEGPLGVKFLFVLERPKTVKRAYPVTRPDALKLARAVEDALTGIVWRDDAQVVHEVIDKRYQDTQDDPQRVEITVWRIV
jgi:Holliday junction resolvase RusA-like endonuclease